MTAWWTARLQLVGGATLVASVMVNKSAPALSDAGLLGILDHVGRNAALIARVGARYTGRAFATSEINLGYGATRRLGHGLANFTTGCVGALALALGQVVHHDILHPFGSLAARLALDGALEVPV